MIDAAQTGIGSLAPFPMSPLENFMKHERPYQLHFDGFFHESQPID